MRSRSNILLGSGFFAQPLSFSSTLLSLSGHARVYCAADVLFRFLRRSGHAVRYVRNFTDIDDKIIARAKESGDGESETFDVAKACSVLTEKFIEEFHDDVDALRCLRPTSEPRATAFVRFNYCLVFSRILREKERERERRERERERERDSSEERK